MSKHVLVLALLAGCPSEDNGDYNSCFGAACEQAVALVSAMTPDLHNALRQRAAAVLRDSENTPA